MKKYESWDTFDFSNLSDQEIKKILSKQYFICILKLALDLLSSVIVDLFFFPKVLRLFFICMLSRKHESQIVVG